MSPVEAPSGSSTSAAVQQCLGIVNLSCIDTARIGSAVAFVVVGIAAYCCLKRFFPSEAGNPQDIPMSGAAVTGNLGTAAEVSATGLEAGNIEVWGALATVNPGITAMPVAPSAPPLEDLMGMAASEEGVPQQPREISISRFSPPFLPGNDDASPGPDNVRQNARELASPDVLPSASDSVGRECVVCLIAVPVMVLLPCGHLCACAQCGPILEGKPCPMCRSVVQEAKRVYR